MNIVCSIYYITKKTQGEGLHNQQKQKRILLVDDEPDICMVYKMVLEDAANILDQFSREVPIW